jgi:hypothetical protein
MKINSILTKFRISNCVVQKDKLNKTEIKSKDKSTKVFRIHLVKSKYIFTCLVHTSDRQLNPMHVLLFLLNDSMNSSIFTKDNAYPI